MIPVNLLLVAWVWIGRIVFGAGGWFFVILLVSVVPVLLVALLITTLIGFVGANKPRALTRSQAVTQLAMWAGMLIFGFFLVDFGDVDGSDLSAFTQVVGRNEVTLSISWTMAGVGAAVTVVAWLVLLVLLLTQKRRHQHQHAEAFAGLS
jgi:hypothetical protein